jgi:hypothetical protein
MTYRAVIKFVVKEGLTPNEIHSKFINVYGDSSLSVVGFFLSCPRRALPSY